MAMELLTSPTPNGWKVTIMLEELREAGFELADVRQHVDVFYGDSDDVISPEMPRRVAAELPNSTAHVWPGAGHYGFVDRERWSQFLGAVA